MNKKSKTSRNKKIVTKSKNVSPLLLFILCLSLGLLITVNRQNQVPLLDINQLTSVSSVSTPTPTPTPPPTPSPTPFPTLPPPIANQAPTIHTAILPVGVAYTPYSAPVSASDSDSGAYSIIITASGLPTGLSLGSCTNNYVSPTMTTTCRISGKSIRPGKYQIVIKAVDYHGVTSTKTLPLTILKSNTITPIDPQPTPIAN